MLNIGRKTFRNLPEQVGFLTGEVNKIWEALDGLDVYDNVVILENLDPLTPAQLEILNKPVSFIVYNNTLYMKKGVSSDKIYFESVFQVRTSGDYIYFDASELVVSYPLGVITQNNTSTNTYGSGYIHDQLDLKADKSNTFTKSETLDAVYPVGSIYISTDPTSPASLFGGTWERIKDRFLLGAGDGL